ncbi:MAG: hypothetical protein V1742_04725, partial [Pseudomonadota bacterium]
ALALHNLDDLDAKMNGIGGFIERHAKADTGWTDYNRLMERFFYRPDLADAQGRAVEAGPEAEPEAGLAAAEPEDGPETAGRPDPDQLSFLGD